MTLWCTVANLWCQKLCAVFLTTLYVLWDCAPYMQVTQSVLTSQSALLIKNLIQILLKKLTKNKVKTEKQPVMYWKHIIYKKKSFKAVTTKIKKDSQMHGASGERMKLAFSHVHFSHFWRLLKTSKQMKTVIIGTQLFLFTKNVIYYNFNMWFNLTWKTVTIAHRSESKFFRSHWQRPVDFSSQLHWRLSLVTQNLPPNRFMPSILQSKICLYTCKHCVKQYKKHTSIVKFTLKMQKKTHTTIMRTLFKDVY